MGPRKLFPRLDTSDPTITWEAPMNQIIRQPLPRAPLPPIEKTLRDLKRNSRNNTRVFKDSSASSIPPPARILRSQHYGEAELVGTGQSVVKSKESYEGNPYIRRADEIGPSHRIPGLTHLGGLLVPPGWKEGDEPISPQAAQALYETARREARHADTKSMVESTNLSADAQEKRNQERDKRWDTQLQLDHMVLEERIKIYEKYQERKRMRVQGASLGQLGPLKSVVYSPPLPVHPPTSTTLPVYARPVHTDTLLHPLIFTDAHGNQVGQQGKLEALRAVIH